ncbi:MAG: TetR/AcrR family transcriptional regulator [Erysipelotrichaceae bacterium]|nr:TetR/AcrR family transcriptional regulator [Erysipelotrichaceae bacterium]
MKLDEKKADKKRRMMAAAFECFNEKGFMNTAINDICTKAGVAKGTFYLYFSGRSKIVRGESETEVR